MPTSVEEADAAKEKRFEQIRDEAAETGRVAAPGIRAIGAPFPTPGAVPGANPQDGYYGLPLLKQPPWIWTVPVYLFVGGAAGASGVIAAVSRWSDEDPTLAEHARWIALAGAAASPVLLVSDLGRPLRFLNMLRVFKPQSPMSVGVWTLMAFSAAAGGAVAFDLARQLVAPARMGPAPVGPAPVGPAPVGPELKLGAYRAYRPRSLTRHMAAAGQAATDTATGLTGLALSTYTGVLFGVSAIPVWARNVRLLPFHFGTSGMASAVALLELMGHDGEGMWRLAIGTSIAETAVGALIEMNGDRAVDPLKRGPSGTLTRIGGALSGPLPLALRLLGRRSRVLRYAAAVCSIAGSLVTRFAWLHAGRASALDPRVPLDLPAPRRLRATRPDTAQATRTAA